MQKYKDFTGCEIINGDQTVSEVKTVLNLKNI